MPNGLITCVVCHHYEVDAAFILDSSSVDDCFTMRLVEPLLQTRNAGQLFSVVPTSQTLEQH